MQTLRESESMTDELPNPNQILSDLVDVLDNCNISSWQTVHWRKELDVAIEYLNKLNGREHD